MSHVLHRDPLHPDETAGHPPLSPLARLGADMASQGARSPKQLLAALAGEVVHLLRYRQARSSLFVATLVGLFFAIRLEEGWPVALGCVVLVIPASLAIAALVFLVANVLVSLWHRFHRSH